MKDITIVAVDCVNIDRILLAFKYCETFNVKRRVLFTNLIKNNENIEIINIPKINNLVEYSHFMIKQLNQYIDTSHILIIQYDGYILNKDAWSDEFLKYDYIGAPWHNQWKKDHPDWNLNNNNDVGNGGFSLRSKKLLEILSSDYRIINIFPEDTCICKTYYYQLLQQNIMFAPHDIARKFAVDGEKWEGQFGFHSLRATDLTNYIIQDFVKNLDERIKNSATDIKEHLSILYEYANKCEHVTEFGVRWGNGSTLAFLKSNVYKIISYDIDYNDKIKELELFCNKYNRHWLFKRASTTEIQIEETDLLFIDTLHTYNQLKKELELHHNKVKKYLIFHDVVTYANKGEITNSEGIKRAIIEFLEYHKEWIIELECYNNNGLLVLKRI